MHSKGYNDMKDTGHERSQPCATRATRWRALQCGAQQQVDVSGAHRGACGVDDRSNLGGNRVPTRREPGNGVPEGIPRSHEAWEGHAAQQKVGHRLLLHSKKAQPVLKRHIWQDTPV